MKIWRQTPLDGILLCLSVAQTTTTLLLARGWGDASWGARAGGFALLVVMTTYNIVVVSHLFTHGPWFRSPWQNGLVSMLNSINIGQSVQAYRLTHVRNHHRYNNDRKGPDGRTRDTTSTYRDGERGGHAPLHRYAILGAAATLLEVGSTLLASAPRLWRVGASERELVALAVRDPSKRAAELRQVQLDRAAQVLGIAIFLSTSWRWTVLCYLPALFCAFTLVNVQNYHEHFGASPGSRLTDSVSHYGALYNLLTFNDGYHQEHHLRPQTHWSALPDVRREHPELDAVDRVVSPVPAMLGFLRRGQGQLGATSPPNMRDTSVSAVASAAVSGER